MAAGGPRWYGPTEEWPDHPKPWFRKALTSARAAGWWYRKSADSAHIHGTTFCKRADDGPAPCKFLVFSSGVAGETKAKELERLVRRCPHNRETVNGLAAAEVQMDKVERLCQGAEALLDKYDYEQKAIVLLDRAEQLLEEAGHGASEVDDLLSEAYGLEREAHAAGDDAERSLTSASTQHERPGELMIRIPLRVRGLDLDDEDTLELLGEHLSELAWSQFGDTVLAVLYTTAENPVAAAIDAVRKISHFFPDAEILDVDEELVSASDIAFRTGVSREAVRLWVEGHRGPGNFPAPVGIVGNGKSKVWRWRDVNPWLRNNLRIGEDETSLTPQQVAELNAALLRVKHSIDKEWETVTSFEQNVPWRGHGDQHLHELLSEAAEKALIRQARSLIDRAFLYGENDLLSWFAKLKSSNANSYVAASSTIEEVEEIT